jgi:ssDNA-binding replication factor A large subunit
MGWNKYSGVLSPNANEIYKDSWLLENEKNEPVAVIKVKNLHINAKYGIAYRVIEKNGFNITKIELECVSIIN